MKKPHVFSVVCLALALTAFLPARAQVYEALNLQAQDVIVRNINDSINIVYGVDPQTMLGFFALDDGSGTLKYFYLSNKILVNDMETDGILVYFCGSMVNKGVIGYFDWKKVYIMGNGSVTYIPCTIHFNGEYYVHVTEYTKMDFFYENGDLNFALIGDAVVDSMSQTTCTVVTSAWPNGSQWSFRYEYNRDGLITYTDIAALDDAVAVVGNKNGADCYWKGFRQVHDFPSAALGGYYKVNYLSAIGPSLIARIGHNQSAVVHHGGSTTTVIHRLEQNMNTGWPLPFEQSYYISPLSPLSYGNQWHLFDLRFVKPLFLLENADHKADGSCKRWILDLQTTGNPSTIDAQIPSYDEQVSLSINNVTHHPFTFGFSSFGLLLKYAPIYMPVPTNCSNHHYLSPEYGTPTIDEILFSIEKPSFRQVLLSFPPVVREDEFNRVCE